ncbi:MAG: hypothetical protein HC862_30180 [Scytonema sp. RU_4_4]|nr:hypothetical protein [Scytonema sp. RU_4_4]
MGILSVRFRMCYLLLVIAIAAIAFACSQNTPDAMISSKSSLENCRIVKHEMGETCIPLKPQRIVTLAPEKNLDPLVALGIKPIGFTSYFMKRDKRGGLFGASWNSISGAQYVGTPYQPSLEKILMLKPDLILSYSNSPDYRLLSAIAKQQI